MRDLASNRLVHSLWVSASYFAALLLSVTSFSLSANAQTCEQSVFRGIDTRLRPDIVGTIPNFHQRIVGFEFAKHIPIVATSDAILGVGTKMITKIAAPSELFGMSVDQRSNLLVQTRSELKAVDESGFDTDAVLTHLVRGRLYNSGNEVFLEVRSRGSEVQLIARAKQGRSVLISTFEGAFSTASWDEFGLAAIVADSLYVWQAGSKKIVRLMTDRGLESATDVVLVAPRTAIVALKEMVILVNPQNVLILAGIPSARARLDEGVLYLVDGKSGVIWSLKGLNQVGTKAGDRLHALDLLKGLSKPINEDSPRFLEAARILGCNRARQEAVNPAVPHSVALGQSKKN